MSTTTRLEDIGDNMAAAISPHPEIPGAVRIKVATNATYPDRYPGVWIDLDGADLLAAVQAALPDTQKD